jgi:hypothetical protein
MDASRFDALARALVTAGSRRRLLGLLATLPLVCGLAAFLGEDEAAARGHRHRRRVKHHKHGKGRRRKHHKKCQPNSLAKTCAGKCGKVKNNCQKTVDCGSCACDPPCEICFLCNEATGVCEPDPNQQGDACGEPGQVCQSDGDCACDASSCAPCERCQGDGACSAPCGGTGCCDTDTCVAGTSDGACGTGGQACVSCPLPATCGGGGQAGVCGCTPITTCPGGLDCGDIDDGCGSILNCGDCTPPETCGGDNPGTPNVCGCTPTTCAAQGTNCGTISDGCFSTLDCGNCSGTTPICVSNVCTACSAAHPCPSGCCANTGSCQPGTADAACGTSGACVNCGFGRHCVNGACVCDSTSCPNGCCDATGRCQVNNNDACGTGGEACSASCPDSQMCQSGACVNCSIACSGCTFCLREANGSWHCGTTPAGHNCAFVCTTTSDCGGGYVCAEGVTYTANNSVERFADACSEPAGTNVCGSFTAC